MSDILLVPAIDIRGGKCVRLFQGDPGQQTVYPDTPAGMAKKFEEQGARRIHVVDLDGAFAGKIVNWTTLAMIRKACGLELEWGGGIRSMMDISRLRDCGVKRFILGSSVVNDPHFFETALAVYGSALVVGMDLKDGALALKGWKNLQKIDLTAFLANLEALGVREIILTDIGRDGSLTGPNLEMVRLVLDRSSLDLTVSGGLSSYDDIRNIKNLKNKRVRAIILGKAIYEGRIDLRMAHSVLEE